MLSRSMKSVCYVNGQGLDMLFSKLSASFHTSPKFLVKVKPNNVKGKNVTSQQWLRRQLNDPYVQRARIESYRCRSAFKLLEIDDKHHIFKCGDAVIDCGSAPGSWSQVVVQRVNSLGKSADEPVGRVIGVDIAHMMPVDGATILPESDFLSAATRRRIEDELGGRRADVLVSDMAPNATGVRFMDHEIIMQLCYAALEFSARVLRDGGTFLCKAWQGSEQKRFEETIQRLYTHVKVVKPQASRTDSSEVFLLARGFQRDKVPPTNPDSRVSAVGKQPVNMKSVDT